MYQKLLKKLPHLVLVCMLFALAACQSLPEVQHLPTQKQSLRLFKVEQLNQDGSLQQASLLSLQAEPTQWRWVQTDPLGAPLARVLLTQTGWQNDGFVMPNQQAKQLFSALATALNPAQPLFQFSQIQQQNGEQIYYEQQRELWRIRSEQSQFNIRLADQSQWRITEFTQ